jgi:hypothetical protein
VRISPFTQGGIELQGGRFDLPDRLFHSMKNNYYAATTENSDVREMIPEFFYVPEHLLN